MKSVFIIAMVTVAMIGIMVPSSFAQYMGNVGSEGQTGSYTLEEALEIEKRRSLGNEHVHAGILVKIFGDTFDFTQSSYQISSPYIHFEGKEGFTIHRHASDIELNELFNSIGIELNEKCFIFPDGESFCSNSDYSLNYFINNKQVNDIGKYVIKNNDRILISYGSDITEINQQLSQLEKPSITDVNYPKIDEPKQILDFVDKTKDASQYVERYITESTYKEWFDSNFPDYTIWEGIGISQEEYQIIVDELTMAEPEPIVDPEPTPEPMAEPETINFDSLSPTDTSIEKGMWIKYHITADLNFPGPLEGQKLMEMSMLNSIYGLAEQSDALFMEYQLSKIDGIRIEIVDIGNNDCKTQGYLVMTDGSEKFVERWMNSNLESGLCQDATNIKNKKIGDFLTDTTISKTMTNSISEIGNIKVKEFDTITINGKKVDVIIANGKDTSYDSDGKFEIETEMVMHKHSGILLGTSVNGKISQTTESGDFYFSFFANDVSEHFVGTPAIPNVGGGCLIATATYGSEMSPQVQQLRELRDNQLLQTESGTAFMGAFNDVYYSFSPIIADYERENPLFKEAVKIAITPMISSLSLMENANSESEVLSIGISVIALNLGMYIAVPAVMIIGIRKRI